MKKWNNILELKEGQSYNEIMDAIKASVEKNLETEKQWDLDDATDPEEFEIIADEYQNYFQKNNMIDQLKNKEGFDKERFIKTVASINLLDENVLKRLKMMTSYTLMANQIKKVHELTDEEIQYLSYCFSNYNDETDLSEDISLFLDDEILKVINASEDLNDKIDKTYDVLDFITASKYDAMDPEEYIYLKEAVIKSFKPKSK